MFLPKVRHERFQPELVDSGYKGSIILANATAISHDETFYADPWRFDPDRYIPKEQGGRGEPLPSAHFGYGRR